MSQLKNLLRKSIVQRFVTPILVGVLGACLLLTSTATLAGLAQDLWERKSHVSDMVTDNGDGTWTYDYTVHNDSEESLSGEPTGEPIIVDWELPYFSDAGFDIDDVFSPDNWSAAIETIGVANLSTGWGGIASWQNPSDPFYAGPGSPFTTASQVLHWYSDCWADVPGASCETGLDQAIFASEMLGGFGFTAAFDETPAPYQASWAFQPVQSGDPAFPLGGLPASPGALGQAAVPEPATLALMGLGLAGIGYRRHCSKKAA